ncbi:hypothetical protein BDN71DRAFT_1432923 [Pleurotus eryngii]|uniref:Uncharacterized protein n=1 Tax=Pleurotus eryngii TaxID=5323 RepID=A0A9P5ZSH5_PLEER|nr:hypothetical protein BDN71DRAFT_1432923 [Pleurotus eryngii]
MGRGHGGCDDHYQECSAAMCYHRDLLWGWLKDIQNVLKDLIKNKGIQHLAWFAAIIWFPLGATILIQSALMRHSNTLVHDRKTRYSVTQYSAGRLFYWIENGLVSDKQCNVEAKCNPALKVKHDVVHATC